MDSIEWLLRQIVYASIPVLPWITGGLGVVALVSFSPLGRAMAQRLSKGAEDSERSAAILEELGAIRGELEEVLERQYTMERMLADSAALRRGLRAPSGGAVPDEGERVATPV
jgi:hypothetical protein